MFFPLLSSRAGYQCEVDALLCVNSQRCFSLDQEHLHKTTELLKQLLEHTSLFPPGTGHQTKYLFVMVDVHTEIHHLITHFSSSFSDWMLLRMCRESIYSVSQDSIKILFKILLFCSGRVSSSYPLIFFVFLISLQDRLVSLDSAEDFVRLAKEKYPKKEAWETKIEKKQRSNVLAEAHFIVMSNHC